MARNFFDIKSLPEKEVEVVSADVENLMKFSKPVQQYNILHTRSQMNPIFLPRCLNYKIKAKRKKKSKSSGTIVFNYMDSTDKILKAEFVKNFTCPFCLMPCGGHEGIRLHLLSSHEVFDYKFWQAEIDHPEVDVSLKPDAFEFGEQGNDNVEKHKKISFSFCSKRRKISQRDDGNNMKQPNVDSMELDLGDVPRVTENELSNVNDGNMKRPNVDSLELDLVDLPRDTENEVSIVNDSNMKRPNVDSLELDLGDSPRVTENELSNVNDGNMKRPNVDSLELDLNDLPRVTENELSNVNDGKISPEKISEIQTTNEPEIAQSSKPKKVPLATRRRKLTAERSEARRVTRLQSRQFYHSQTSQPMSLAEVMSDADSEGEPDDDSANLKERLWLNQLVNVSDEDKRFMHLWNIFVRKQRVIADGHVPWACEEFTKLHEKELNGSLSFFWKWKHFMIHLWNRGLVSAHTIDKCSTILENSKAAAAPSTSRDPANGN